MNLDLAVVLGLLLTAVVLFVLNKPRMDAVALLVIIALPLTGIVTVQEALAGFSDPNIVLIAALFVIGDGLVRTGVAQRMGDWLAMRSNNSETRLLVLLMASAAALGSVMSSTGVVAIFIPIVLRVARQMKVSTSRLMMPLSVAGLISGMLTLVATTPNLVIHSELVREGLEGFEFFSFTPFGIPILIVAIAYMLFARRWLSSDIRDDECAGSRPAILDFIRDYDLANRELRLLVTPSSQLVGQTLRDARLRTRFLATVVAVERSRLGAVEILSPSASFELIGGDVILVDMPADAAGRNDWMTGLSLQQLPLQGSYFSDRAQDVGMAEILITPNSQLVGKSIVGAEFGTTYGAIVVGLRRNQQPFAGDITEEELRAGDTLLLIGPWDDIRQQQDRSKDYVLLNLPAEHDEISPASAQAPYALFSLAAMVVLMVTGIVPNVIAALIACFIMGAFRCITLDTAYKSIHWQSLILIVGMLPFSIALQRTGGIDLAVAGLVSVIGDAGPYAILASLFVLTAVIGLFVSNTATAVLMAPVAIATAQQIGVSPYPFAMTVALASSAAFMTPISSPVNTLVYGPGGYTFGDFAKVGVPLAIIVMIISVLLVPQVLPL
ncbi:MAG: SLC13 family permease [Phyllobacterium sp.]